MHKGIQMGVGFLLMAGVAQGVAGAAEDLPKESVLPVVLAGKPRRRPSTLQEGWIPRERICGRSRRGAARYAARGRSRPAYGRQ